MKKINSLVDECGSSEYSKLYEFLAVSYDISDLAKKIYAAKNAKINILNLKKIGNSSII